MLFLGRFSDYKRTNHPSRSVHVMGSFYASIHLGQFELSFSRGPWEWGWWSIPFIQNKTSIPIAVEIESDLFISYVVRRHLTFEGESLSNPKKFANICQVIICCENSSHSFIGQSSRTAHLGKLFVWSKSLVTGFYTGAFVQSSFYTLESLIISSCLVKHICPGL